MSSSSIPQSILDHRYGGLLGKIWREVHCNDGIVTIVFCGKRGKGKSFSMAEWARILDKSPDDRARFVPENIRFDPVDFFKDLTGKYPIGKPIVLDDAGLHMYKSDALKDLLKRISKILQNIRYKHPIILLSLPYFGQLMKDARDLTDIYIEMHGIDKEKKLARGQIQTLKISPFTTDLYRYTVLQSERMVHPEFKIDYVHWLPKPYFFNKPSDEFIAGYDAIKAPALDKINNEHLVAIANQRDQEVGVKKQKMNFPAALQYVRDNMEKAIDPKGEIIVGKIMSFVDEAKKQMFTLDVAKNIKQVLRDERM